MKRTLRAFCCMIMIATVSGLSACKKNEEHPLLNSEATVTFQGLINSDGCGYVIILDNVSYHPENLPEKFKADDLKVKISARFTGERFQCGLAANLSYPIIHINSISKR